MLLQSRQKRKARKQEKSLHAQAILENPQIRRLMGRVNQLVAEDDRHLNNPLNMIRWRKVKYHPSEAEVRMHVQNQISLSKVLYEKIRARVKPIKSQRHKNSYSGDKVQYREKYEEFKSRNPLSTGSKPSEEEEFQQSDYGNSRSPQLQYSGVKFYDKIKKYSRVLEFVVDKTEGKDRNSTNEMHKTFYSMQLRKQTNFKFSPNKTQEMRAHTQTVIRFEDSRANEKVDTIMQKWKPVGRSCKSVLKKAKSEVNRSANFHHIAKSTESKGQMSSTFYAN